MVKFIGNIDIRCRQQPAPCVAMLDDKYIIIGTAYGYWHTTGGDIRTWHTRSGAYKALKRYVPI